jgi:hypothetical protein
MWFASWYRQADRALRHSGSFWTFLNWRTVPVVMRAAADAGVPIGSLAVWDKEWMGPGGTAGLRPSYEMVALLARPGYTVPNRGVPDVFRHKVSGHKPNGHPAEKPVGIIRRVLEVAEPPPGGLVLDPFTGSGTTLLAARELGLRAIGIEAEEKWCEVTASRLAQDGLFAMGGVPA